MKNVHGNVIDILIFSAKKKLYADDNWCDRDKWANSQGHHPIFSSIMFRLNGTANGLGFWQGSRLCSLQHSARNHPFCCHYIGTRMGDSWQDNGRGMEKSWQDNGHGMENSWQDNWQWQQNRQQPVVGLLLLMFPLIRYNLLINVKITFWGGAS